MRAEASEAENALEWVRERPHGMKVGAALNKATPKYIAMEKVDGVYRVYHYADGSQVMSYIDPKKQELWIPVAPAAQQ